jgi:thymidylate synthase (FAD)
MSDDIYSAPVIKNHQPVLDHGYVRFIDRMGTDETVIEGARMSTGKGFLGWEPARLCVQCGVTPDPNLKPVSGACLGDRDHRWADTKGDASLLEFLYKNQHLTPFEMCELHVEVYAPIFVFREWHRHRTFSFNEFSSRYAQMPNEHYLPELERFRPVHNKNKQESSTSDATWGEKELASYRETVRGEQGDVYENYELALMYGVPKEIARINTPVSRYSKMRAKTDLRNWLAFLKLRMAPDAQLEIRMYANTVAELIKVLWPRTWALFEEHTLGAKTFSKSELERLKTMLNPKDLSDDEVTKGIWKKVFP